MQVFPHVHVLRVENPMDRRDKRRPPQRGGPSNTSGPKTHRGRAVANFLSLHVNFESSTLQYDYKSTEDSMERELPERRREKQRSGYSKESYGLLETDTLVDDMIVP